MKVDAAGIARRCGVRESTPEATRPQTFDVLSNDRAFDIKLGFQSLASDHKKAPVFYT